ncbi:hypothetical protein JTE90_023001 [Oedothorax gibbosus]|uniref:Uncharacterized protein n=1 Tax=Oedothorax gibbosus TaxID=931172 RepID=A0AAV6VBD6_9ARAC|nr:hypothetical protein JTE90_023001 [Oedothorax gibbosus]
MSNWKQCPILKGVQPSRSKLGSCSTSQVHESAMDLSIEDEEQELQKEPIPSSAQTFEPRSKKKEETPNSIMAKAAAALESIINVPSGDNR